MLLDTHHVLYPLCSVSALESCERARGGGGRKRASTSDGGSEQDAKRGRQTDAVSAERRGMIALIVRCYLTRQEVILEEMVNVTTRTRVCYHAIGQG